MSNILTWSALLREHILFNDRVGFAGWYVAFRINVDPMSFFAPIWFSMWPELARHKARENTGNDPLSLITGCACTDLALK